MFRVDTEETSPSHHTYSDEDKVLGSNPVEGKIVISVGGGDPGETGFGRLVEARQPPFRTRSAITLRSPSALRVGTPNGLEPLASTATVKLKITE